MPAEEKFLILKLDLSILVFSVFLEFTKSLDQQAISNAYVSGMREDLNLGGNQLNYIIATFYASNTAFIIPACYLVVYYPANVLLPALEICWGLSTFGLVWAKNIETVYAMRFLTGLFESCAWTGVTYVIGSWYKPGEIGRRIALLSMAQPLGVMFSGYIQAAAYTHLDDSHELAAWRWLFIFGTVITVPLGTIGFYTFVDIPSRKRPRFLTPYEFSLAQERIDGVVAPPQLKFSREIIKRIFKRWHWYIFVLQWILIDQIFLPTAQPFLLYLKANSSIYSIDQINTLPTGVVGLGIVLAIICAIFTDRTGNFILACVATTLPILVGLILLVVWDVNEIGRLAAFWMVGFCGALFPLTTSWATLITQDDAEERVLITASMNAIGQAIMSGTQIVQYPASSAPNFHAGFCGALATTLLELGTVGLIWYLSRRDNMRKHLDSETIGESQTTSPGTENEAPGEKS